MTNPTKPLLGRRGTSVATWCLLAIAAGALILAVVLPVHRLTVPGGSVSVTVTDDVDQLIDVPGLPEGASVVLADGATTLDVYSLPTGLRLLTVTSTVVGALGVSAGAWWLARVLHAIGAGRPFDVRNPARLGGVAAAVLASGLLAPIIGNVASIAVLDHLDLTGPESPFTLLLLEIPFAPIVLALVALAAAETFRRGSALVDDSAGLV